MIFKSKNPDGKPSGFCAYWIVELCVVAAVEQPSIFLIVRCGGECKLKDVEVIIEIPPAILCAKALNGFYKFFGEGNSYGIVYRRISLFGFDEETVLSEQLVIAALFYQISVKVVKIFAHSLECANGLNACDICGIGQINKDDGTVCGAEVIETVSLVVNCLQGEVCQINGGVSAFNSGVQLLFNHCGIFEIRLPRFVFDPCAGVTRVFDLQNARCFGGGFDGKYVVAANFTGINANCQTVFMFGNTTCIRTHVTSLCEEAATVIADCQISISFIRDRINCSMLGSENEERIVIRCQRNICCAFFDEICGVVKIYRISNIQRCFFDGILNEANACGTLFGGEYAKGFIKAVAFIQLGKIKNDLISTCFEFHREEFAHIGVHLYLFIALHDFNKNVAYRVAKAIGYPKAVRFAHATVLTCACFKEVTRGRNNDLRSSRNLANGAFLSVGATFFGAGCGGTKNGFFGVTNQTKFCGL